MGVDVGYLLLMWEVQGWICCDDALCFEWVVGDPSVVRSEFVGAGRDGYGMARVLMLSSQLH